MIRYLTAGESHGQSITAILEGLPAGIRISEEEINLELSKRQKTYGRGARMKIESDKVKIKSGVRFGETIGSPVTLEIENKDWKNWLSVMSVSSDKDSGKFAVLRPRPGHADLAGILKYDRQDTRDIFERASARETAIRCAVGAVCRQFLFNFGISIYSFTKEIGGLRARTTKLSDDMLTNLADISPVRCPDPEISDAMIKIIDEAAKEGNTLGGIFSVVIQNVPAGLGSHIQWDRKLDARLARAVLSIQSVKGIEFGTGFAISRKKGSVLGDEILYDGERGFYRTNNHAGGIEGGISNGEKIIFRAAMKPIPSLKKPLNSVNIRTKKNEKAEIIRSDICAVPAGGVIAENVSAVEIADAFLEKFGGDSLAETERNFSAYMRRVREF